MKKKILFATFVVISIFAFNKTNKANKFDINSNIEAISGDLVLDFDYWKDYWQEEVYGADEDGENYGWVEVKMLGFNPRFDLCVQKSKCNYNIYQRCFYHK